MSRRTLIIILLVVAVAAILLYVFRDRIFGGNGNGNGQDNTLSPKEELPPNVTTESIDEAMKKAFNPEFWKTSTGSLIYTVAEARDIATKIYDAIGYVWDRESDIVKEVAKMKTKSQSSFVAYYFRDQTGEGLYNFINKHVDKADFLEQIQNHIYLIPDYKV